MSWIEDIKKAVTDSLRKDIEDLTKSEADRLSDSAQPNNGPQDQGQLVGSKAILTDPYYDHAAHNYFLSKSKISRIANRTLREISMRDWLVNAILQIRCDTVLRFSRPQEKKYDMGYRFVKTNHNEPVTQEDIDTIRMLEDYIYHCGRTDATPRGEEMLFGEFVKLITWDALTFGHVAVEKVLTRKGSLHRFRPLPAETVYRVNPNVSKDAVENQAKVALELYHKKRSDNDPRGDGQVNTPDMEYLKYVQQTMDMRVVNVFGDEDMVFKLFNPKNFADSNGYAISMVEQAVIMITNHLNVESYNANYFTHGYAARGILHLKGTVTQNTLASFRRQFYNTISGSNNAWRTPIVSGLDDVQWIPMSGSAREMEYINFNSHVMRSICAQFQIDPIEVGLDYLTTANGRAASQAKESGQFKITYSRERGLLPILYFIEDLINQDIIPALDKELASKYKFKFVGYTDDTAQTDISLRQAQMTVFSSMNDLLKNEDRKPIDHPIADLPLNQAFWGLVDKMMTKGEQREVFLGDSGATQRQELQYLPGDPMFLQWQNMLMTKQAQKEAKDQQQQQMAMQQQQMEHEHDLQRQQVDHDSEGRKQAAAEAAVKAGQSPVQQLQETAKEFGVTRASNVEGRVMRNPINVAADTEKE
jgi:hypothetical protein